MDHGGPLVAVEDRAAVDDGDRVAVDVDDPGVRVDRPGDLVHVADGRDARAQVEELPDPAVQAEPHGPPQERPVGAHDERQVRPEGDGLLRQLAVDREVVRPAEVVVVDPGRAGAGQVDVAGRPVGTVHWSLLTPLPPAHRAIPSIGLTCDSLQ
nr:hypothetical protein GCM10020241_39590 [Streptoalloteichus tenebrarius]